MASEIIKEANNNHQKRYKIGVPGNKTNVSSVFTSNKKSVKGHRGQIQSMINLTLANKSRERALAEQQLSGSGTKSGLKLRMHNMINGSEEGSSENPYDHRYQSI